MHFLRRQRRKTIALIVFIVLTIIFSLSTVILASQTAELNRQLAQLSGSRPSVDDSVPSASTTPDDASTPSETPSSDPVTTMDVTGLTGYQALYPDLCAPTPQPVDRGDQKIAYLTFDDGPSELTRQYLDVLDSHGVKATFFVVPKGTEESNAILREIAASGHTIGIHTKSHSYTEIYASVEAYLKDFYEAFQEVYQATGIRPTIFRFPGGSVNQYNREIRSQVIEEMTRRGFVYYDWNVSGQDASTSATSDTIYDSIMENLLNFNNPQILLHDSSTQQKTLDVLPKILDTLKENGYTCSALDSSVVPVTF